MGQPHVEFDDVESMVRKTVAPGGRVTGLGDYVGREVLVLVLPAKRSARGRGRS